MLKISKNMDITSFAIVTGNEIKLMIQVISGQPLNYTFVSPVNYILDGIQKNMCLFTEILRILGN